jgi:hypothetical protein
MHGAHISYCLLLLQTRNFWYFSAPSSLFSLYVLISDIYSPVPFFIGCIGSPHIKPRSGLPF